MAVEPGLTGATLVTRTPALVERVYAVLGELREATAEYAAASAAAAEAEIDARRGEACIAQIRADVAVRAHEYVRGLVAGNKVILAPERDALVAATIERDPTYDVPAATALALREAAQGAAHRLRVADQRQKALRAELAALTALAAPVEG